MTSDTYNFLTSRGAVVHPAANLDHLSGVRGYASGGGTGVSIQQERPKRVYRIVLGRGVQEVTCTSVATDEGFLKFYDTMIVDHQVHTSVVAMYPSTSVQQVTSVLESEVIVV